MTTNSAVTTSPPSIRASSLRRNLPYVIVYGLLIVLLIIGSLSSERFFTDRNLANVLREASFLGIIALGQTIVILTAGIDLSIGAVIKMSVLLSAIIMNGQPANIPLAALAVVGLGVIVGATHAFLITRFKVPPFVVTLGTYGILRGIAYTISTTPIGRAAPELVRFYDIKIGPVYLLFMLFLVLLVVLLFMLRRTRFGRYIYAVGGNEQVARLSGVPVTRVKYGAYILCSVLAAVAGLMYLTRYGVGDPSAGDGRELEAITAVILGGTSLFGGRGSLLGTFGGALLLTLTNNVIVVSNVSQYLRDLISGSVIVIAVALYKQKGR